MGGMMGSAGAASAWIILLWSLLGLAVVVTAGILAVRALHARHPAIQPQADGTDSAAVRKAKDALRLRYASGEISREDYLQGKVELED
jgi:putative membrane protein